jgi:O-acetyl-ADP-ribose deacetylase (regulator of RNase III)
MVKYIKEDLFNLAVDGAFDVVIIPCNCFCDQKSVIAKQLHTKFPEIRQADLRTEVGDVYKLGSYSSALIKSLRTRMFNLYVQYDFGAGKFEHAAFGLGIRNIATSLNGDEVIGMPQIGAGGAGGNWNQIERIIKIELSTFDVNIIT